VTCLRRNGIASSNELRKVVGWKPSNDPRADELFNPNIADKNQNQNVSAPTINKPEPKPPLSEVVDGSTT
jgi:hypothetical protein